MDGDYFRAAVERVLEEVGRGCGGCMLECVGSVLEGYESR